MEIYWRKDGKGKLPRKHNINRLQQYRGTGYRAGYNKLQYSIQYSTPDLLDQ